MSIQRRKIFIISLIVLIIVLVAGGAILKRRGVSLRNLSSIIQSNWGGNNHNAEIGSGRLTDTFNTKDGKRWYVMHLPKGYDTNKRYPVLLHLHGGTGTAKSAEASTGFSDLADERGFIVVYGQAITGTAGMTSWNAGNCCGTASAKQVDDVGYVREVIKRLESKYSVDTDRIYVSGMSNGSMLANRLACEAADLFAGAATVSGTIQVDECHPSRKMPMLIMHGTDDINVPYHGGPSQSPLNKSTYISVDQEFKDWGERNGCSGSVTTKEITKGAPDGTSADLLTYDSCDQPLFFYRVNGGIHGWPGGKGGSNVAEHTQPSQAIDASKTIADFFKL